MVVPKKREIKEGKRNITLKPQKTSKIQDFKKHSWAVIVWVSWLEVNLETYKEYAKVYFKPGTVRISCTCQAIAYSYVNFPVAHRFPSNGLNLRIRKYYIGKGAI